jgi:DNA-binding GntR family transcriptional regulator
MPVASKKVKVVTLRHQIAAQIRRAILEGSVAPGERLVERTLGFELGASVTAVREAIIQLEGEGLITKRSNSSTNVSVLTVEEIGHAFVVRHALERVAMMETARRATASDVAHLKELFDNMVAAARQRSPGVYVLCDFAWHEAVWDISGNEILASTLRRIVLPLFGLSSVRVISQKNFNLEEDALLHAAILEAIARNDPEGTAKALESGLEEWQSQVEPVRTT